MLRKNVAVFPGRFGIIGAGVAVCALLAGCSEPMTAARREALSQSPGADVKAGISDDLAAVLAKEKPDLFTTGEQGTVTHATPALLVDAALERNADIAKAAQAVDKADAQHMEAVFGYLPQISMTYTHEQIFQDILHSDNEIYEQGKTNYPDDISDLTLSQPIINVARLYGIRYARTARSVAEINYLSAVRDATYEVIDNYLVAQQSYERLRFLRQRDAMLMRQVAGNTTLVEAGLDTSVKDASVRGQHASNGAEEALEQAKYEDALAKLSKLTGTVVTGVTPLHLHAALLQENKRLSIDTAVKRGLEDNPAIMSGALSVVGADLKTTQATATDYTPVLDAFAELEREDRDGSRFGGGSTTRDTTVGVSLTIPLFNANGNGYKRRAALVDRRSAVLDYYARRRSVETEIRTTYARMVSLAKAVHKSETAAADLKQAYKVEKDRLATGESVDLVVASRELQLNQSVERAFYYRAEYLRAYTRLHYLMGDDLTKGF